MEIAMSAVISELVSQSISFLLNKYCSESRRARSEKMVKRLQHLLARARAVVDEADGLYITNSGMLVQLKMLADAMYGGYSVLDCTSRYQAVVEGSSGAIADEVISYPSTSTLSFTAPVKRSRTVSNRRHGKISTRRDDDKLHGALESLEIAVANMVEFVMLLGGCERMSRRPYDSYLYIDNFMFGRHVEKQKLLSFLLLQHSPPSWGDDDVPPPPPVLPIIGGTAVGKKTLVAHVCRDDKVRSRFSSVVHLNGDSLLRIQEHDKTMSGMTCLVIVELASDVDDEDWKEFCSFIMRSVGRGSKVIIVSKLERVARFGSVKPIFLGTLSYEELRYLFKTLAFGTIDPTEHPQLAELADEFVKELHMQGSLVTTNAFADVLRRNPNVQFWLCVLNKGLRMVARNISIYGVHPNIRIQQGQQVDITDLASHPLRMTPYTATNVPVRKKLPKMAFGELLLNATARPKGEFILVPWESRLPPYTSFANFVQDFPQGTPPSSRKKRQGAPI